jgi:hypothetical protein
MAGRDWTAEEVAWFFDNPDGTYWDFTNAFGSARTMHGWRMKRASLALRSRDAAHRPTITDNAKEPDMDWREWVAWMKAGQALRKRAKGSPDGEATIAVAEAAEPVAFIVVGDTHLGAWSADLDVFERVTDDILSVPNLYVALMGDLAHMAIKLRGVVEVGDNLAPADMQLLTVANWLQEFQDRVLFACWGNHEVERVEVQAGLNPYGELYKRAARHYFNGIGHLTITVNGIDYRIAASHVFRGRSEYNPCHAQVKYVWKQGPDRDIAIAADSHVPGILHFTVGPAPKLAVNCGSSQTQSGYAQRYFSLFTHPTFPVVVLDHERKAFTAHPSIAAWRGA